jgi:hypothetical protein
MERNEQSNHKPGPVMEDTRLVGEIVRLSAMGFLASMALTTGLWFDAERSFPSFPAIAFLTPEAADFPVWDLASVPIAATLAAALCGLLIRPGSTVLLNTAILSAMLLAGADVHRLQPWVFQYLLTFGLARLLLRDPSWSFASAIRFLLIGTYFWSGIQKMNPAFKNDVLPFFLEALEPFMNTAAWHALAGQCLPSFETVLGLGLLFVRIAPWAGAALIGMHLLILLALGPFGHATNAAVWPWNLVMIGILLRAVPPRRTCPVQFRRTWRRAWPLLVLTTLAPALGVLGWWPSYLSMSLYSGNVTLVLVQMDRDYLDRIAPDVRELTRSDGPDSAVMSMANWAYCELGVPGFPERQPLVHAANAFRNKFLHGTGKIRVVPRRGFLDRQEDGS